MLSEDGSICWNPAAPMPSANQRAAKRGAEAARPKKRKAAEKEEGDEEGGEAEGGQEAEAEFFEVVGLAEWQRDFFARPVAHAGLHEAKRGRGRDGFLVAAGVVAVGVGDEGERLGKAGIIIRAPIR